jgi:hypothetical protein
VAAAFGFPAPQLQTKSPREQVTGLTEPPHPTALSDTPILGASSLRSGRTFSRLYGDFISDLKFGSKHQT